MNERNAHDDTKRTLVETRRDLAAAREAHEDTIKAMQANSSGGEEQRSALTGTRGETERERERERERDFMTHYCIDYMSFLRYLLPIDYMTAPDFIGL